MAPCCPNCESKEVRISRRKRPLRKVFRLLGIYQFRCQDCGHQFRSNIHRITLIVFAKCPSCHRMDLSRWTREFYNPGWWTRVMLAVGAKPVRCEYCRHNFWSFRLIREKFSKAKRFARSQVVIPVESEPNAQTNSEPNPVPDNETVLKQADTARK